MATQDACGTCCDPNNKASVFDDALVKCACADAAACKTECGTDASNICTDPETKTDPAQTCIDCLNGTKSDACATGAATTACKADTGCDAALTCISAAKCGSLPAQ